MPRSVPMASRTSLIARSHACASSGPSRTWPPLAGSVASTVWAAATLPDRRPCSVYRRNSPAASGSSRYASGSSRASTGSSGGEVGPAVPSIAAISSRNASGSSGRAASGSAAGSAVPGTAGPGSVTPPISSATWLTRLRSITAWEAVKRADTLPRDRRKAPVGLLLIRGATLGGAPPAGRGPPGPPARRRSPVVAHRGPQTVTVQDLGVSFHRLAGAVRHHRLAPVVHVQHELLRLGLGVAEYLLEHVGDIGHEVDRVVPDDGHPRCVGHGVESGLLALNLSGCHTHRSSPP